MGRQAGWGPALCDRAAAAPELRLWVLQDIGVLAPRGETSPPGDAANTPINFKPQRPSGPFGLLVARDGQAEKGTPAGRTAPGPAGGRRLLPTGEGGQGQRCLPGLLLPAVQLLCQSTRHRGS